MEDEISRIIEASKNQYIPSLKEINDETKQIINFLFEKYLNYQQNTINKKEAYKILEHYHPIEFKDISKGDFIKYFNDKYFYDVGIKGGGFVVKKNKKMILLKMPLKFITIKSSNNFFRKLTQEELAKIKIMETLKKIDNY